MDLSDYTQTLRQDLTTAAALGDENTRRIAEALAGAAENSARLMLLSALSDLATEISDVLGDRTVHVRLDGTQLAVEVGRVADATEPSDTPTDAPPEESTSEPGSAFDDVTGEISRVTLRLVEQIKARAEESAAQNGVSLNSWIGQAVQGALRDQARHGRYGL
ncbi:toxin-antitoxin system HicB family antitoxin [Rhodococcus sp. NPDC127528]|uniref:toxin-antitoxin system HicB family antitoxin n=1 Tax=unclassified Rhodococcus (in: high G+C Gram-positive bacteria) TaxID=192944 RepID=UPI00362A83B1